MRAARFTLLGPVVAHRPYCFFGGLRLLRLLFPPCHPTQTDLLLQMRRATGTASMTKLPMHTVYLRIHSFSLLRPCRRARILTLSCTPELFDSLRSMATSSRLKGRRISVGLCLFADAFVCRRAARLPTPRYACLHACLQMPRTASNSASNLAARAPQRRRICHHVPRAQHAARDARTTHVARAHSENREATDGHP